MIAAAGSAFSMGGWLNNLSSIVVICGGVIGAVAFVVTRGKRDQKIDEVIRKVTANGNDPQGDSPDVGNIARRTEQAVTDLRDAFREHTGASHEAHRQFRRDIARIRTGSASVSEED